MEKQRAIQKDLNWDYQMDLHLGFHLGIQMERQRAESLELLKAAT